MGWTETGMSQSGRSYAASHLMARLPARVRFGCGAVLGNIQLDPGLGQARAL